MEEVNSSTDKSVENSISLGLLQPGNDTLGYILFLSSLVLWAEGNNLRSINILLIIIAIFWLVVNLMTRTKLFTKKEKDLAKNLVLLCFIGGSDGRYLCLSSQAKRTKTQTLSSELGVFEKRFVRKSVWNAFKSCC